MKKVACLKKKKKHVFYTYELLYNYLHENEYKMIIILIKEILYHEHLLLDMKFFTFFLWKS